MKRLFAICVMVCVIAGVWAQEALVTEVVGKVEMMSPGGSWIPVAKGMSLGKSSSISTGFKSVAVLKLGASSLTVKPLTKLTLEELAAGSGKESSVVYLNSGRVGAQVKAPEGGSAKFTVKSPTATASVRGTGFGFDGYSVNVNEGIVFLSSASGPSVNVPAGSVGSLDSRGAPMLVAGFRQGGLPETVDPSLSGSLSGEHSPALPPALTEPGTSVDVSIGWW